MKNSRPQHKAIAQMKRAAKQVPTSSKELNLDAGYVTVHHLHKFVLLTRPHGTHLFPVDTIKTREHWNTTFCSLVNHHTQHEPMAGYIYECGKLRRATLRQCHHFLVLHNGEGRR